MEITDYALALYYGTLLTVCVRCVLDMYHSHKGRSYVNKNMRMLSGSQLSKLIRLHSEFVLKPFTVLLPWKPIPGKLMRKRIHDIIDKGDGDEHEQEAV